MPILWWEKNDFTLFKRSAVAELVSFMRLRGEMYTYVCINVYVHKYIEMYRERCMYISIAVYNSFHSV
jgi:hypothetical protein